MSNVDTKANARSILRRSSVVLQRRFSRDSTALEDFQAQQYNAVRRASVQQGSSYQPPTFQISASFQGSTSFMTGSSDSILNNIPPPRRRASITPAPYAPASYGGRRSSVIAIASSKKTSNTHERVLSGSLSKSSGIPYRYQLQAQQEQQSKADQLQQQQQLLQQLQQHQHDYKKQLPKGQSSSSSPLLLSPSLSSPPLSSPLRESLSLTRDFKDMSVSDWDMSSNCSEVSEVFDEVDYTDPSDWFLDEEMEDEPMFEILEREDLLNRLRDSVASVASQLNVSEADAVLVLQQFNWDLERLLQDYFDKPNYYLKQAGVTEKSSGFKIGDPDALYKCKICLDDKPCSEFFALGCDHEFCKECWQEYLQGVAVTSGPSLTRTSCMAPKCTAILTEKDIERIALPSTLQRYMYFLLKEFSEKDLHSVMCPHPTCGNAVVYSGVGRPTDVVECHCGTRFCFSCGHEKHNPVCCEQLSAWQALLQDDSGSLDLIRATSKPCAHCGTFTERISGCNHMICRRGTGGCGGEWCWMCRKDWASHGAHTGGFYSCNKYEESEAKIIDDKSQEFLTTKNESKFLHYYNRYFNHDVIMKDVMKQLNSGEVQVTMVEYTKLTNTDPEFFLEAAELLVECRRVLKYTYVYGYYMEDGPSKALFEYQQASAEGITERLSELFHTPVDVISKSPLEFVNYVRVTKKFISNLVKSIEEGFSSDLELPSVH